MNVKHMLYCSIVILLMTMLCIGSAFAAEDDAIGISMQEDGSTISSVAPTDFLPKLPESIDSLDNVAGTQSMLAVNAGAEDTAQIIVGGKFNLTTKARSELHISFADWKMDELGYVCEVENETVLNFVTSGHSYLNLIPRNVGDTNITITSNADSSINTTVHVVVEETVVSNITLPSNPEFSLGTTGRLSAILYDQFGNLINHDLVSSPEKVEWSIESGDALTLTQANGIDRSIWVNPVQIGTSVVRATSLSNQSVSATANVKIVEGGSKVLSIMPTGLGTYIGDDEYQLSLKSVGSVYAYVSDEKTGNEYNSVDISWSVDDESVISLTPDADINNPTKYVTLKPLQVGTATITATSDGVSKSFKVSVVETVVSSVSLSELDTINVSLDSRSRSLGIYVYDQFDKSIHGETVSLTVDKPEIIKLSQESIDLKDDDYLISLTQQSVGTATITLAVSGTSITKTYTVNVFETEIKRMEFYSGIPSDISLNATSPWAGVWTYDQFGDYVSSYDDIEWTSSDTNILDFDYGSQTSKLMRSLRPIPKSTGSVTITATPVSNPSLAISRTITVHDSVVSSVYLDSILEISLNSRGNAFAYVRDQFGNTLPNELIRWSVVGPQIVSLSETESKPVFGISLIPISSGTTTIRATSVSNDALYWEQDVTVETTILTGINVSCPEQLSTGAIGSAHVSVSDQFGNALSNEKFAWSIIDGSDVIEISEGNSDSSYLGILPLKEGEAKLKVYPVSNPDLSKEFTITVSKAILTDIYGSCSEQLSTSVNGYAYVYVRDQFGNDLSNEKLSWNIIYGSDVIEISESSSGSSVQILPLKEGEAKLKVCSVSNPDLSKEFTITVSKAILTEISGSCSEQLSTGAIGYASANLRDQFDNSLSNEKIAWSIIEGSDVIEIRENSNYPSRVDINPLKEGTAKLKAYSVSNPDLSKEFTITVYKTAISKISGSGSKQLSTSVRSSAHVYVYDQFGNSLSNEMIRWSVADSQIVSLSVTESMSGSSVTLIPKSAGTTTIRATVVSNDKLYWEQVITVETAIPTKVYVYYSPQYTTNAKLTTSAKGQAHAYIYDQFGNTLSNEKITWSITEGSDVIEISVLPLNPSYVNIIPLKEGTAKLRASSVNTPDLSEEITITVEETQLTTISGSGNAIIPLMPAGTELPSSVAEQVALVYDQFRNIIENEPVIWEIVDGNDVIDIKADALYPDTIVVIPKKLGSATIKATSAVNPSLSIEKKISVVEPEITLRVGGNDYMTPESTYTTYVSASVELGDDVVPRTYSFSFTPDDLQLTLVSGEGVIELKRSGSSYEYEVKALSPGVAVIRATALDGALTADKTITVVSETEKIISLDKTIYLSKGAIRHIYSNVCDQFGNRLNDEIIVSATPESVLQVVNEDGVFTLKPQATGEATVTVALAQDPTVKREASVIIDETIVSSLSGMGYIPVLPVPVPLEPTLPSTYETMVGSSVHLPVYAIDQYGNYLPNEELILDYDATGLSVDSNYVTLLKEGSFTLTVTVKNHPEFTRTFTFTTSGVGPVDPPKPPKSLTVPAPVISPNGDTFSNSREVSISSNSDEIYYTLDGTHPTTSSLKYEGPFSVTETTTVLAIAFNTTSNDKSSVAKAVFLKDVPEQKYNIKVVEQLGGTVIVDKTTANADDLITLTATANDGWKNAGFVITGETSGKITEKTSSVNKFSMWRENITVFVKFEELGNPKASTVKFFREPGDLYVAETVSDRGTLTAEVYDQFGDKFTDSVTWSSDSPDVIEINSATGAYTAKSPGAAAITATSVSDNTVKGTLTLYVYVPPMPQIMGEVNNGALPSVEFGVMSEPFVVDTKNTNYLYWDWDDGSTTKLMVKSPSSVWTNGKYPAWTTSKDSVAHTFIKYGSLQVKVVPKNNYREGDEKIFTVTVTHAAPKNLKITSGPKSVTAGDTATYTAFATNAKSYVWYLDDTEITGQTGASATITFPEDAAGDMSVKVKAYNGVDKYSDLAAKIVSVAQKDGALGLFGETLTTNPEKPIVGEITTFGIAGVENAVEYLWTFSDGGERTTTAPAVQYALKATDGNTVTVTAYNSTKQSVSKTFEITGVGEKPTVTLTADRTETEYGTSTTFTASGSGTYSWFIDNVKVDGATSSTYTKSWDYDDIGEHSISVTLTTDYGTATDSVSVLTLTKEGAQSIIKKVIGKTSVKQGTTEKYKVNVMSKDDYTISWYLNGEKKASENINKNDIDSKFFVHTFNDVGRYKLEVEVTTEYEETSFEAIEIDVLPANEFNSNTAKKALEKSNPSEADKIMPTMKEGCTTKNSLGAVSGIVFDKNDLNEDGEPVSVELLLLDDENLKGFTNDMGQKDNILFGIDIKPTGLKNEKVLSSYALITIPVEVSKVGNDPSVVKFYRYDTGSDINSWEVLTLAEAPKEEGKFWLFTVQAGGMSQFVGTFDGTVTQPPEVGPSDDKDDGGSSGGSSSGGSGSGGSSGGASAVTPITPTAVETVTPTETVNPTESVSQTEVVTSTELAPTFPSTTPTAMPKSPVPVFGLIFGALVGYKLFRRR